MAASRMRSRNAPPPVMGFLDRFRPTPPEPEPEEPLFNAPSLLSLKLLFTEKPVVDAQAILAALRRTYPRVEPPPGEGPLLFFFPEVEVEFTNGRLPAQCTIMQPDDSAPGVVIAPEALQQNWDWPEAAATAESCRYELPLLDLLSRPLAYPIRTELFMNFVVAVVQATRPQVVYAQTSQKLLQPAALVQQWTGPDKQPLAALVKVRLFNISNGQPGETVLDTLGLHALGLPDVQVHTIGFDPSAVAGLLWNYAYYLFQHGDIIDSGNTIAGLEPGSRWVCDREMALVGPERMVLNIQPD